MSTLNVSNITDGTDTVETGYVVNGSAKAWIKFIMAGTAAINNSLNVSSLVDAGTGDFDITVTNAFNSNHYVTTGSNFWSSRGNQIAADNTASMFNVDQYNDAAGRTDSGKSYCTCHGDLA